MQARGAGLLAVAAGLCLGAAAQAGPTAAGQRVTVKVTGIANETQTAASGTFIASGAISDSGKFTIRRNPSTFRDSWHLSGKHGTISVSDFGNKWTIVSGTGSYVHLRGSGSSKETSSGVGGSFHETWTGTVTR